MHMLACHHSVECARATGRMCDIVHDFLVSLRLSVLKWADFIKFSVNLLIYIHF